MLDFAAPQFGQLVLLLEAFAARCDRHAPLRTDDPWPGCPLSELSARFKCWQRRMPSIRPRASTLGVDSPSLVTA